MPLLYVFFVLRLKPAQGPLWASIKCGSASCDSALREAKKKIKSKNKKLLRERLLAFGTYMVTWFLLRV